MSEADLERITREIRVLTSILGRMAHSSFEHQLNRADVGLSPMQFGVMRSLCHEPHTITELSRKFVVDPSTLVPVIDTLESKGFVLRSRDPNDRRRFPVTLTESGLVFLRSARQVEEEDDPFSQAVARMGQRRARALRKLLLEVLEGMPQGDAIIEQVLARLDAVAGADEAAKRSTMQPE